MTSGTLTPRLNHQFAIIADAGYKIAPGMRVLDFGCGAGACVESLRRAGYDAFGCDVSVHAAPQAKALVDHGWLREIALHPYRLPFDDATFDLVLSDEVFEHVQNYPEAISELNRVMKQGAVSLHLFPSRWIPVEPHVYVPLASVVRAYPWLWIWAALGIRNPYQRELNARETARHNREYLTTKTNYLDASDIKRHFGKFFPTVRFAEALFLKHSGRGALLYRYARHVPLLLRLYSACWNRVVLAAK
jgi:cyclopropane fatty-acyl-phospholipid synthase-like methyltransferase